MAWPGQKRSPTVLMEDKQFLIRGLGLFLSVVCPGFACPQSSFRPFHGGIILIRRQCQIPNFVSHFHDSELVTFLCGSRKLRIQMVRNIWSSLIPGLHQAVRLAIFLVDRAYQVYPDHVVLYLQGLHSTMIQVRA